ncbi:uncharacterized protein LOC111027127 isoform X2 [Myzus persicae]|uniref:uncharacterized protein LOC111027127 isoform X2 n=1 Tax=Myzus persicae TaxID=13164 RepID=UPI000B930F19|nr:uncharacterized protein LOC111027127 isoform X2 [Myzus persicae]
MKLFCHWRFQLPIQAPNIKISVQVLVVLSAMIIINRAAVMDHEELITKIPVVDKIEREKLHNKAHNNPNYDSETVNSHDSSTTYSYEDIIDPRKMPVEFSSLFGKFLGQTIPVIMKTVDDIIGAERSKQL